MAKCIYIKKKTESTPWSYPETPKNTRRTAGAFRAIKVDPLLVDEPKQRIELWEWSHITYNTNAKDNLMGGIKYAAISHVWKNTGEVEKEFQRRGEPDRLQVRVAKSNNDLGGNNESKFKKISWNGLAQAARAARHKGARYFWVDYLCIDQQDPDEEMNDEEKNGNEKNDEEKDLQIALMATIYKCASCVIIMIAGIVGLGRVDHHSGWIDRAWTLQEAIINSGKGEMTYIYVQWIQKRKITCAKKKPIIFDPVKDDDCLIPFRDMFLLADMRDTGIEGSLPKVTILNGLTKKSGDIPRKLLFAATFATKYKARVAAMWRSMYLRQSTKEADIVYSLMGCLGLRINPHHNYRSAEFLFNDLARRAAISPVGPAWLTISGVTGSKILRDDKMSQLMPQFPKRDSNGEPFFIRKNKKERVAQYIDSSGNYIENYDIKFLTQSHPHIISAKMFKVKVMGKPINSVKQPSVAIRLGKTSGTCYYRGNSIEGTFAVYVGKVAGMGLSNMKADRIGNHYFLFLRWINGSGWSVITDGTFRKTRGLEWTVMGKRWLFTIGDGAQKKEMRWPQNLPTEALKKWLITGKTGKTRKIGGTAHTAINRRNQFNFHSYGFTPFLNTGDPNTDINNLRFEWVALRYQLPIHKSFQRLSFTIDISDVVGMIDPLEVLSKPAAIHYVGCKTAKEIPLPNDLKTAKEKKIFITDFESIKLDYVHRSWRVSRKGEEALDQIPGISVAKKPRDGKIRVHYWIKVKFRSNAVFFIFKQQKTTKFKNYQIYVFCYGRYSGGELKFSEGNELDDS